MLFFAYSLLFCLIYFIILYGESFVGDIKFKGNYRSKSILKFKVPLEVFKDMH